MTLRFALSAVGLVLVASPAYAHFHLDSPDSFQVQDDVGDPQKEPPCGDPGTASNLVTTVMVGSMLPITITETVTHPGHYRVALAQTIADLPPDPPVTAGTSDCGSTTIENPPVLPILADDELDHTTSFNLKPQTMMVQLPDGMLCDHCVLQVIEFMSNHQKIPPGNCFYHHCATITIAANAPDAGTQPGADAGTNPMDATSAGCCSTGSSFASNGTAMLIVGVALGLRRSKRGGAAARR